MKYHFEKNALSIILLIIFCLLGLCALIPVLLLIEYLFEDYFTYGVLLLILIIFGVICLICFIVDKRNEKVKETSEKLENNIVANMESNEIHELENQASILIALVSTAEAMPNIADSTYSSYLNGMGATNSQYNKNLLIVLSNKMENIINCKNEMPFEIYKELLFKTYQENIALFEKIDK